MSGITSSLIEFKYLCVIEMMPLFLLFLNVETYISVEKYL